LHSYCRNSVLVWVDCFKYTYLPEYTMELLQFAVDQLRKVNLFPSSKMIDIIVGQEKFNQDFYNYYNARSSCDYSFYKKRRARPWSLGDSNFLLADWLHNNSTDTIDDLDFDDVIECAAVASGSNSDDNLAKESKRKFTNKSRKGSDKISVGFRHFIKKTINRKERIFTQP